MQITQHKAANFNTISVCPHAKDYAIVDEWVAQKRSQFALEYERTLKSGKHYERIRTALQGEHETRLYSSFDVGCRGIGSPDAAIWFASQKYCFSARRRLLRRASKGPV